MKRFILLFALCAASIPPAALAEPRAAALTDADAATLRQTEQYLNALRTLKAHFVQRAPDGKTEAGTAWLSRPGRMRFEYDKPSPLLLVAGHGTVVFRDNKLDQTTNIPMDQTPLGLLLRDTVSLGGDVTVTNFIRTQGQLQITVVKTAAPGDGSLTLLLDAQPLALAGWSVVDAQGRQTTIRLSDVQLGGSFDPALFTYVDPHSSGGDSNIP
jgi:outer membrane lipoprotein-sorting protein